MEISISILNNFYFKTKPNKEDLTRLIPSISVTILFWDDYLPNIHESRVPAGSPKSKWMPGPQVDCSSSSHVRRDRFLPTSAASVEQPSRSFTPTICASWAVRSGVNISRTSHCFVELIPHTRTFLSVVFPIKQLQQIQPNYRSCGAAVAQGVWTRQGGKAWSYCPALSEVGEWQGWRAGRTLFESTNDKYLLIVSLQVFLNTPVEEKIGKAAV